MANWIAVTVSGRSIEGARNTHSTATKAISAASCALTLTLIHLPISQSRSTIIESCWKHYAMSEPFV